jgi:N-acetyl-gamma-glutamyl-phosphate reductase
MNAYRISGHQHVYEIERELGIILESEMKITFTPHVVPMTRGILSTLYGTLEPGQNINRVLESYRTYYENETFVRVFGPERPHSSTDVRGSNFCNISLNIDDRTGKLIVISLIDNLMKGQAGSAVQNMNIMFGLDEGAGLLRPGLYP